MYQSGPIRMEARLREIQRERKGEAEADAQQNRFICAHTSESIPPHTHCKLKHSRTTRSTRPGYKFHPRVDGVGLDS